MRLPLIFLSSRAYAQHPREASRHMIISFGRSAPSTALQRSFQKHMYWTGRALAVLDIFLRLTPKPTWYSRADRRTCVNLCLAARPRDGQLPAVLRDKAYQPRQLQACKTGGGLVNLEGRCLHSMHSKRQLCLSNRTDPIIQKASRLQNSTLTYPHAPPSPLPPPFPLPLAKTTVCLLPLACMLRNCLNVCCS